MAEDIITNAIVSDVYYFPIHTIRLHSVLDFAETMANKLQTTDT